MWANRCDYSSPGFSICRAVVQLNHAARTLLRRIYDAGIKWPRINMQTDRALGKLLWVQHTMHRISRINGARVSRIHFDRVRWSELALSMVEVLRHQMKIFYV